MVQFETGSTHSAKVVMTNPTSGAFDYNAILYMGVSKATMAEVSFHLNAGESKEVTFAVVMPTTAGEYPVYISVFSGGALLGHYQSTENVTIVAPVIDVIDGELRTAYAWWEGLPSWEQITYSNTWPVNTSILTDWEVRNTGNVTATFKLVFMEQQGSIQLNPGEAGHIQFTVNTGSAGSYNYTYSLYGDNKLLGSESIEIIVIAPIAGEISHIWMWHEPLEQWGIVWIEGFWTDVGPEIPLNEDIYLVPCWDNTCEVSIVGHVDLEVTYPDGTKVSPSATAGQDAEVLPGKMQPVDFYSAFIATQEGTYTIKVTLSSGGQVLDSVTFTLVVVAVALPFTFSNLSVQRLRCESSTAWNTLSFWCTITNPTSGSITHTLTPMYRTEDKYGYGEPKDRSEFNRTITIPPGGSYNYYLPGNQPALDRCTIILGFSAGVPYGGCAFLRDENGNDSPQACR